MQRCDRPRQFELWKPSGWPYISSKAKLAVLTGSVREVDQTMENCLGTLFISFRSPISKLGGVPTALVPGKIDTAKL